MDVSCDEVVWIEVARLNVRDSCNWKSLGFGLVSGAAE
jgi:hypothetical protein